MKKSSPSYFKEWDSYSTHPLQPNSSTFSFRWSCLKVLVLRSCVASSFLWIGVLPTQKFGWIGHHFDPLLRSSWSLGWAWYPPEQIPSCLFLSFQPVFKAFSPDFCFQLESWSYIQQCDFTSSYRRSWFGLSSWFHHCWYCRGWGWDSSEDAFAIVSSASSLFFGNYVELPFNF